MKIGDLPNAPSFDSEALLPVEVSGSTGKTTVATLLQSGFPALTASDLQGVFSIVNSNTNINITSSVMKIIGSRIAQLKFVGQTKAAISVDSTGLADGVTNGNPIGTIWTGLRPALETVAITLDTQGPIGYCKIGTDGKVNLFSFAPGVRSIGSYTNLTFVATYIIG